MTSAHFSVRLIKFCLLKFLQFHNWINLITISPISRKRFGATVFYWITCFFEMLLNMKRLKKKFSVSRVKVVIKLVDVCYSVVNSAGKLNYCTGETGQH